MGRRGPTSSRAARWELGLGLLAAAVALVACRGWLLAPTRAGARDPFTEWFFDVGESAPQIALLVVGWMVWVRRDDVRAALRTRVRAPLLGLLPLALAAYLELRSLWIGQVDLQMDAFLLGGLGCVWLLGGARLVARFAVPGLFLALSRPLPPLVANPLLYTMQTTAASAVGSVVDWFGRPAIVSGDLIVYGERAFQVIETCSGLRIVITLLSAALLVGEVLGRSPRRILLLFLCAPLVGFAVNVVRIITLVVSPWAEEEVAHSAQGVVMLVVGVLLLWGVDRLLERGGVARARGASSVDPPSSEPADRPPAQGRLFTVIGYWGLLATASFVVHAPSAPVRPSPPVVSQLPMQLPGWQGHYVEPDFGYMGSVRFSSHFSGRFVRAGASAAEALPVDLFLAQSDRRRRDRSPRSPKARILGRGYQDVAPRATVEPPVGGRFDRSVQRAGPAAEMLVYYQTRGLERWPIALLRWWLALDADPRSHPPPPITLRLSTPVRADAFGSADDRLADFLRSMIPVLEARFPQTRVEVTTGR